MPAHVKKILKMQVGEYTDPSGKTSLELREIGVLIEHQNNGDTWHTVKLHADVLQPVLFQMVKPFMLPRSSSVNVRLYDVARKKSVPDNGPDAGADHDDMGPERPF